MEEFILRLIERVGFPIGVSLISFWCVFKLFQMRERERDERNDKLATAMGHNTVATNEASNSFKRFAEAFGSDPKKLCQAEVMAKEMTKLGMTQDNFKELLGVLNRIRKQNEEAAQRVRGESIAAKDKDEPPTGPKTND